MLHNQAVHHKIQQKFDRFVPPSGVAAVVTCYCFIIVAAVIVLALGTFVPVCSIVLSNGEQGWRSGESARLPPMWPVFDSRTRRHTWVEFIVSSRPCSEGHSPGSPVFLLHKNQQF